MDKTEAPVPAYHSEPRPAREHVFSALKALASANPISGALCSLLSDYLPNQKLKRIEAFLVDVSEALEHCNVRLDEEQMHSEHFGFMLEHCIRAVASNPQDVKLSVFKNMLANEAAGLGPGPEEQREFLLHIAQRLTVTHVRVLRALREVEDPDLLPKQYPECGNIRAVYAYYLADSLIGESRILLQAAVLDLEQAFLIRWPQSGHVLVATDRQRELGAFTSLGADFYRFCLEFRPEG